MTTIFYVEKCDAHRWKADKILVSTVCNTVLYLIWLRSKVQTRLRRIFSKVQNFWPFFLLKLWRQFRFFSNKLIFFNQIPLFVSFQVYECLKVSKFVRNTIKNSDFFYFLNFLTELCLVQLTELSEILNFWKISSQMCLDFTPQPDKVQNRVAYRWNENFVSFSTVCVTFFYVEYCSHGAQICLSTFFLHTLYIKSKAE